MSDAQFESFCRWIGDRFQSMLSHTETTMESLTIVHWMITGIFVIVFGLIMMRGLGLKKYG
jgi:hypothetical protein